MLTASDGQIVMLDLDGNAIGNVAEPGAYLFGAVWSPDGSRIAYSRTTGGPVADMFISLPDGTARQQVTDTPENESR